VLRCLQNRHRPTTNHGHACCNVDDDRLLSLVSTGSGQQCLSEYIADNFLLYSGNDRSHKEKSNIVLDSFKAPATISRTVKKTVTLGLLFLYTKFSAVYCQNFFYLL